ncbi:MAG: hypothetical protein MUP98_19865 [Candidatus Aminicenantes bacterium]|nr:hypothetical protein [Candidatus Aminicenantes bacterium]
MAFNKLLKKFLLYGVLPGFVLLFFAYGLACWDIGAGVKSINEEALEIYQGNGVSALMKYADSEEQNMQKRNRAVWALGQLGDPMALPVLLKHYTSNPCDHTRFLCQHELKKAIKLCKGAWNASAWTWRRHVN